MKDRARLVVARGAQEEADDLTPLEADPAVAVKITDVANADLEVL